MVLASHMGQTKDLAKICFLENCLICKWKTIFLDDPCKTGSGNHQIIFGAAFLTNHLILVFRKVGSGNTPHPKRHFCLVIALLSTYLTGMLVSMLS